MDQLNAMRIYARVAELGSFTATADNLGLLKATVSNAVHQLENSLGTQLLHRTTRKVQMTHDGQLYYERCRDLLADMEELSTLFCATNHANLRGRLRVDMPISFARDLVIPRLPEFLDRHPQVEVELSSTDRRVDLVREGFDCAVRVGMIGDQSLIAVPIGVFEQINCASPAYLARYGIPETPEDLGHHRMIHFVQSLGARTAGFEYVSPETGKSVMVPMAGVLTVNNSDAYREACRAGLGILQAPRLGVIQTPGLPGFLSDGSLVEILPTYRAPPLPFSIVYTNRRHLPLRVKAFIEWLKEVVLLITAEE